MGDVIAAFPVQYSHVGRLRNDVYRTTSLTRSRSLGIATGTPIFRAQFTFDALDINIRAAGPAYWCGIPTHEKNPQPLCLEEDKTAYAGAKVHLGHPMSTSAKPEEAVRRRSATSYTAQHRACLRRPKPPLPSPSRAAPLAC